jgi:indolepyruvate ferredoxin oxidoreductase alpha subunit
VVEKRLLDIAEWGESSPINRIEWGDRSVGIITNGIAYQYVRELLGGFSILKLGMTFPLPKRMISEFAASVERVVIVEELDPFIEEQVLAMGIEVVGKDYFPITGELTLARVREAAQKASLPVEAHATPGGLGKATPIAEESATSVEVPSRPPALCPGCPHRSVFYNLRRMKRTTIISGDIGCYSMGVLPPFEAMDTLTSMGASIGMGHGLKQAGAQEKVVATIGDSTFFHAGLSPLANAVYNKGNFVIAVLDNRITAMTGGQEHPGTGITLQGEEGKRIEIAPLARAMGVEHVWEVDAWDVKAVRETLKDALEVEEGPAVVVVKGACVFTPYFHHKPVVTVDHDTCNGCGACFRVGCPSILKTDIIDPDTNKPKSTIDPLLCTGCTVCLQVCPRNAIYETGSA